MTEEHEKLLATFEVRLGDLISLCNKLKEENTGLQEALSLKDTEVSQLKQMIDALNIKYNNLLTAKALSAQTGDVKDAQQRLSKLVREVDRCIALLNE